jgi:hypothetical protein
VNTAKAIPKRYRPKTIFWPFCWKKAAANNAYTVKRAPQLINGAIEIVMSLSLSRPSVLAATTDGTLQPNPTINSTNVLPGKTVPGKPMPDINLSITKAARDM